MNRILLVRTYENAVNLAVTPPLGIMYLASMIRKHAKGWEVGILDTRLTRKGSRNWRLKTNIEQIKDFKPDIIGFSSLTYERDYLHQLAMLCKKQIPSAAIIAGGPYPTFSPRDPFECAAIDYAFIGEAERTLPVFISLFQQRNAFDSLDGIAYRKNNEIKVNPPGRYVEDLDSIPFPAWDLVDIKAYNSLGTRNMMNMQAGRRYMPLFTTRACPYSCTYCHQIFGKGYRKRSVANVILEMEILIEKYGIDEFHFFDDIFNLDRKRTKDICRAIIDKGWKIHLAFPNGLRGDILDAETIELLRAAGTYKVMYAVETASQRLQKKIGKNIDLDKIKWAIEYSQRQGMITKGYFMLGFPDESLEEMRSTIDFAVNSRLQMASFFEVVPQPGTRLYEEAIKLSPQYANQTHRCYYYAQASFYQILTGIDIKRIQRKAYIRFYSNPLRVLRLIILIPRKIYIFKLMLDFVQIYSKRLGSLLRRNR